MKNKNLTFYNRINFSLQIFQENGKV